LAEAARRIGIRDPRKLRRALLAAERRAGKRIGSRSGERHVFWRVTERQARLAVAVDHDSDLADLRRLVRSALAGVEQRSEEVARETAEEVCAETRQGLGELIHEVATEVGTLRGRVGRLERGAKTVRNSERTPEKDGGNRP
jgi:hypothetical protein